MKEQQLAVPKQTFGQATSMSGFSRDVIDGILGLGFTALADDLVVPPFINAVNQKLVDKPLFTVWMAHRVRCAQLFKALVLMSFPPKKSRSNFYYLHTTLQTKT